MFKKTFLVSILSLLGACNFTPQEAQTPKQNTPVKQNQKALVAYFSHIGENYGVGYITIGNTQKVAIEIARQSGADIFRIEPVKPYSKEYEVCTEEAKEDLNQNARPELTAEVANMQDYDIIYLGYPVWWGDMPMPVYTFLESYNFEGKTILPFATHEGSQMGRTEQNLKKFLPKTTIGKGLAVNGTIAQTDPDAVEEIIKNWLNK